MTLQEAMEEIFGHGFLFTLRPTKARKALWIIHKALQEYQDQQLNPTLRWIPCSERLPEKDGDYLCISNNEYKILPYRNREFYCVCFDAVLRRCNKSVTHWMPVPDAPAKEKPPQNTGR